MATTEILGILLAVTIAVATALVFALNAPAQLPCGPHPDVAAQISRGR